jgi:hypothetical protein
LAPEDGFPGIQAQRDVVHDNVESVGEDVVGRRIAGQGVIVGDEIKAVVLSLEGKVLTHGAEIVAHMKLAGVSLLISETEKPPPFLSSSEDTGANDPYDNSIRGRECQGFGRERAHP